MQFKKLITNIIFLIIILNCIDNVNSEITFEYPSDLDLQDAFNRYPTYTNTKMCDYSFQFYAIQLTGGDGTMTIDGGGAYTLLASSNSTHFLYYLTFNFDTPNQSLTVIATGNGDSNQLNINFQCLTYDINSIGIEFASNIYLDSIYSYVLPVKFSGIPQYAKPSATIYDSGVSIIRQVDNYGMLLINYYNMYTKKIAGPLTIDFLFGEKIITKSIPNIFNESFNEDFKFTTYPSDFGQEVNLIGKKLYPLISIETTTVSKPIYFSVVLNGGAGSDFIRSPIYESNGKTTYLATPINTIFPILNLPTLSFYVQNKSTAYQALNKPNLLFVDIPYTNILTNDFTPSVSTSNPIPYLVFSKSDSSYYLNYFKFIISNRKSDVIAPFGFISGSNSNYEYSISIPFCPYNPSISIGAGDDLSITVSVPDNSNVRDYVSPLIQSYSFIPLSSSKYLFKFRATDQFCGLGFISFNDIIFDRASQYRASGDQYDGNYEVPIDFDLDLVFERVTLMDFCGNPSQINPDMYLGNIPFAVFNVPFLKFNYNLYNIKDISYLYNNLDVRKNSVGNIMYFTLEGADPLTRFALRLPGLDVVDNTAFFTREFFGIWNASINKFQINFVVPKNSRLGPFKYSISTRSLLTVESDFFSSSSQLIISKSNFDGIGPIFSKVEKIPFSGGKFGWHLAISDPINGFDNGTITVTGSDDNSIYKFNLFPKDRIGGNVSEGIYEIIIDLSSNYCITQDYIITFVKLWDTGAQYTVFELFNPSLSQMPQQLINPFYLFFNDSTINKYPIDKCNSETLDTTPPIIYGLFSSKTSVDVSSADRIISFELQVEDKESGININAQGPIIYLLGENLEMVQCITKYNGSILNGISVFTCSIEVPVGFASTYGTIYLQVFGILNFHGLYSGYDTAKLESSLIMYKIDSTFTKNDPVLIESGKALSIGGDYFVYGRSISNIQSLNILDTVTQNKVEYKNFNTFGSSSVLSISDLAPIRNDFYVSVTSKSGITSNRLLVSPVLFNDYIPEEPLPTNAPQQCLGNPVCGGITHGTCNNQTGCVCIYPWKGKSCQDQIIEPEKPPIVDPNQPSTGIDIPDDKDEDGNPVTNIHYKSLISLYSLREIDINGKTVNNYPFNNKWTFIQVTDLKSYYQINITTGNNFNTTVSATLEWFNQSKTITFADQDLEMSANSIKYNIEISKYPFSSKLNYLQLVMSATLTSTSTDSCSSKDFGETTSGDNSNYINIQIDNKSLYGRFIKRGIIDDNKVVSLSNEILDSTLNAISKPSQTQTYIGITIQYYEERLFIDPDFSVLLSSNSASSNSNSICKSKGLSGSKIAGIVIGATAFAAVIGISIVYYFKKKKDAKKFKSNITNKLKEMNNNGI